MLDTEENTIWIGPAEYFEKPSLNDIETSDTFHETAQSLYKIEVAQRNGIPFACRKSMSQSKPGIISIRQNGIFVGRDIIR